MSRMHRQSLVAYGQPLCETIVDCPAPQGTEVLVRVERCGVCHSDLHLQDGYFELGGDRKLDITKDRALPFTLGHEIAGVDRERRRSRRWRAARQTASRSIPGSAAENAPPARRETKICARRIVISASASMAATPRTSSFRHPRYLLDYAPLSPGFAGPLMCSGLTAYAALKRLAERAERGAVLLIGLGGVGMMGLSIARALFSAAADRRRHRRREAQGGARGRRDRSLRPGRSAGAARNHVGNRRRAWGLRLRRLRQIAAICDRRAGARRQGCRDRAPWRHVFDRRRRCSPSRR